MNQLGGTGGTPWEPRWYRVPTVAVGLIAYAVVGLVIYTAVSRSGPRRAADADASRPGTTV
ncbi:hypothetical protein [Streptomyces sp. NBC_01320]|uniref:hypothetical protein n=1 Tax=Streptomyces sp. NBC_01320 TaxID=2903824 RepID=UPI002E11B887|nr:hypothetical protein OG395_52495 [Streptomyces sp. NBC_01320]